MIDYLCDNADVIAKITLAPEMVDEKYVRQLITAGIVVCFCRATQNATYEEARKRLS